MKIDARLTFEKFRHDQDTSAHLVLTLTAPTIKSQATRPALCIIPVVDVSPSMFEGRGQKIAYARRSVEKLIEHLGPNDYCGLVKFSMSAQVVQRPVKMTADNKSLLVRRVAELSVGNATNIEDALLEGLKLGNSMDLPGSVINRVILFTDGQANRGRTDRNELFDILNANLGSCTLSAFGYGADADQGLLGDFAKKASGNYAYIENPDNALTAFGKELGGLLSTYATSILINVAPQGDHEITEVVSDVDSEEEKIGEGVRIKIPDILAEEVRHIVLAVKIKGQKSIGPRAVNLFEAKAGWDTLGPDLKKVREGSDVRAKAQFVNDGDEQKQPTAELDQIVGLAQVVRAQLDAEEAIKKRGDYNGAQKRMQAMAMDMDRRGHAAASRLASNVSQRLGNANDYGANGGYLRSVATGGTRGYGSASYDAQAAADLELNGVAFSNSLQSTTSALFAGGTSIDAGPPVPQVTGVDTVNPASIMGMIVNPSPAASVATQWLSSLGSVAQAPNTLSVGAPVAGIASAAGDLGGLGDVPPTPTAPIAGTNSKAEKPKKKLSKQSKRW